MVRGSVKRKRRDWSIAVTSAAAAARRTVVLQIELPNGARPQVKVLEGEPASIELNDGQKFAFVPTPRANRDAVVIVTIFDLKATPHRQIGDVEATVGGSTVRSETTPAFGIRVIEVQPAK